MYITFSDGFASAGFVATAKFATSMVVVAMVTPSLSSMAVIVKLDAAGFGVERIGPENVVTNVPSAPTVAVAKMSVPVSSMLSPAVKPEPSTVTAAPLKVSALT